MGGKLKMVSKDRSNRPDDYDKSAEILQIYHDLEGVLRLGQIQTELLKSVQARLAVISKELKKRDK